MTGMVLVQRLKALNQELPVLYMTGGTPAALANLEFDLKCAVLRKPFDPQSLVRSVRHVLDARRGNETCRCRNTGSQPQP
jgi:DNA-binding NtrC family response regulator